LKWAAAAALVCGFAAPAQADLLSMTYSDDNGGTAKIYLSASATELGSYLASSYNTGTWSDGVTPCNNHSACAKTYATELVAGQDYWIQFSVTNNSLYGGLIAQLSLAGTDFEFANHSQEIFTDTTSLKNPRSQYWWASDANAIGEIGTFNNYTIESVLPEPNPAFFIADNLGNGTYASIPEISPEAVWITIGNDLTGYPRADPVCYNAGRDAKDCVYVLQTKITYVGPKTANDVPEPATLALAAGGLGLIGALRRRRGKAGSAA
jgi:hypothetical protein